MMKRMGMIVVVVMAVWLAGCSEGNVTPSPTTNVGDPAIPVVVNNDGNAIRVEGVVVPARSATLRAASDGLVTEVGAAEGERVTEGTVLIRLDTTDIDLAVQQAEAALSAARAQLALAQAGARPEQVAVIEAQLGAADAALAQAVARRDEKSAAADDADALDAQAGVMEAELAHKQADALHDDMMACRSIPLPDGSEKVICPTLGTYEEITRFQMEAAYAAMIAARAQYDAVPGIASLQDNEAQAAVQSAAAQRDAVQAQLDLARAGSLAEAVTLAEAGVRQAEAAVAQAQAALDFTVIKAPFDGTVTDLTVDPGDTAAAGEPLVTVATLDRLQIQTSNLTEMDVVDISVGLAAAVTLDAHPDQVLQGQIARVDPQGSDYLGDVIYTALIEIEVPNWARWGMTAQVAISKSGAQATTSAGSPDAAAADATAPATDVIAEGTLEPERWSALRFVTGGQIAEIAVAVGEQANRGDVLVRLDAAAATLGVRQAEAAVASAQAQLALTKAGPRREQIAAAEAKLSAAQGELRRIVALRDQLQAGTGAESAGVQARLELARAAYEQALTTTGTSDDEDALKQLSMLQLRVRAAEERTAALPGVSSARLRAASAGIQAGQAQVSAAQAELELLQAPPTVEEIAVAEAEVKQAESALTEAQVALSRTEIRAPFGGTVTQVFAEVGETAGAGQPVLVLAALDSLKVTTLDLTELDIVGLSEGQSVQVRVDALPDRVFGARVIHIQDQSADYRGDVTYPVTVALNRLAPELRWGMRAAVEIPRP